MNHRLSTSVKSSLGSASKDHRVTAYPRLADGEMGRSPVEIRNARPLHICMLNKPFYPDIAGQFKWDEARYFSQAGHRVSVICSRNVYGSSQVQDRSFEQIGNIEIHRVRGTHFGKRSTAARVCDFATFLAAAAWKLRQIDHPDVILVTTSPPFIGLIPALFKAFSPRVRRPLRVVQRVLDVYPDCATAAGMLKEGSLLERALAAVTRYSLRHSDAVIALGRDMAEVLHDRYGVPQTEPRFHIHHDWADGEQLWPIPKSENSLAREWGVSDSFNIVHSGNFGLPHDLETVAEAMAATAADATLRWIFIGGGLRYQQLQTRAQSAGWKHALFFPYQPIERLRESLSVADVHLVSQLPSFQGLVVPSKLYGIMAVGRPTIMVGPGEAEVSQILTEHRAGVVVAPGDTAGLLREISRLRGEHALRVEMGKNARAAFEQHFTREHQCAKLESAIAEVHSLGSYR